MRENIKKINMNIYIYNIIMEHRHEHRHTDLCKRFITDVLPEIEKVLVVPGTASRIKRMELIEKFLSSIGCITPWHHPTPPLPPDLPGEEEHRRDPEIVRMAWHRMFNPIITGYPQLIGCGFTREVIEEHILNKERQDEFLKKTLTCSDYIEDTLVSLLDKFRRPEDINRCIDLLICPMKAHFQQFIMKYTRSPGSTEMSTSYATNHYEAFMFLTNAIIEKKIEMFHLPSLEETPNIIISLLLIRFVMIRDLLSKIQKEEGFTGIRYNKMVSYIQASVTLYTSYFDRINHQIQQIQQTIIMLQNSIDRSARHLVNLDQLGQVDAREIAQERETIQRNEENLRQLRTSTNLSTLTKMKDELSAIDKLIRDIEVLHGRATDITQADTPPRPPRPPRPLRPLGPPPPQEDQQQQQQQEEGGGVRHKRVKKNNYKSKKYKKNNSNTKKYKKKNSKSKKYKKLLF